MTDLLDVGGLVCSTLAVGVVGGAGAAAGCEGTGDGAGGGADGAVGGCE